MNNNSETNTKISCVYCADSYSNHAFLYVAGTVSALADPALNFLSRSTPKFLYKFGDFILSILFHIFSILGLAKYSKDIEKAVTLRSKVVWEEALRRGIEMEQLILFGRPTEHFRVSINGKYFYFDSLPIPSWLPLDSNTEWDDKFVLKKRFMRAGIPVPRFARVPIFGMNKAKRIFAEFSKPVIIKPAIGSKARHTTTNISTEESFKNAVSVGRKISPLLVMEEHLNGYVCRATLVSGKLVGFYRGEAPFVIGDGKKSILQLIDERNKNRPERVSAIVLNKEFEEFVLRQGYKPEDVPPKDKKINLSHRSGRYIGGHTKEMFTELHPSFVPILERAAQITGLIVLGFDCIVPDPESEQKGQRWGIIECNTLPFIDLHYFALEGKPQNIAGKLWDLWKK